METNTDYFLQIENAKKAAQKVRDHFTQEDLVKENSLVHTMIKLTANEYDVEVELIQNELFHG